MTALLLVLSGLALVVVVVLDVLASTVRADEGRLTRIVQQFVCMGFSGLYKATGRRSFLAWSGVMVIMATVITWITLLWAGWLLVFGGASDGIVEA